MCGWFRLKGRHSSRWYPCILGALHVSYMNPTHSGSSHSSLLFWNEPSVITVKVAVLCVCWSLSGQLWVPDSAMDTQALCLFCKYALQELGTFTAVNSIPLPSLAFRSTPRLSNPLSQPSTRCLSSHQNSSHWTHGPVQHHTPNEPLNWKTTGALDASLLSSMLRRPYTTLRKGRG